MASSSQGATVDFDWRAPAKPSSKAHSVSFVIRPATAADVPELLRLIRALAAYEGEPDAVETTEKDLNRILFGPGPKVWALVATNQTGRVVGTAIYFLSYSTWTGRHSLYLEDIFVEPSERGNGHGRALMAALARIAVDQDCGRLEWAVLDWNDSAIGFYRSLGAEAMDEWTTYRVAGPALAALASAPVP